MLLFFQGAGVPASLLTDLEDSIGEQDSKVSKFSIVRTVLHRLNAGHDVYIGQRREIVRRVARYDDFSACWPDDRLAAQGLVARVQQTVNIKDSVTRIQLEHVRERNLRLAHVREEEAKRAHKRKSLDAVGQDLSRLFSEQNPHKRGLALEGVVNRLFAASGVSIREPFTMTGSSGSGIVEQVDGAIMLDGEIYLVEMKWWQGSLGVGEVSQHVTAHLAASGLW